MCQYFVKEDLSNSVIISGNSSEVIPVVTRIAEIGALLAAFFPFSLTYCKVTNSVRTPAPSSAPCLEVCTCLRSSNNQAEIVLVL